MLGGKRSGGETVEIQQNKSKDCRTRRIGTVYLDQDQQAGPKQLGVIAISGDGRLEIKTYDFPPLGRKITLRFMDRQAFEVASLDAILEYENGCAMYHIGQVLNFKDHASLTVYGRPGFDARLVITPRHSIPAVHTNASCGDQIL